MVWESARARSAPRRPRPASGREPPHLPRCPPPSVRRTNGSNAPASVGAPRALYALPSFPAGASPAPSRPPGCPAAPASAVSPSGAPRCASRASPASSSPEASCAPPPRRALCGGDGGGVEDLYVLRLERLQPSRQLPDAHVLVPRRRLRLRFQRPSSARMACIAHHISRPSALPARGGRDAVQPGPASGRVRASSAGAALRPRKSALPASAAPARARAPSEGPGGAAHGWRAARDQRSLARTWCGAFRSNAFRSNSFWSNRGARGRT